MPGVAEKIRYEISLCPESCELLKVNKTFSISGHTSSGFSQFSRLMTFPCKVYALPSAYCLAISATASAILFLTLFIDSLARASRSFERMTWACSCCKVKKISTFSSFGSFRDFEAIFRNITAPNDRV